MRDKSKNYSQETVDLFKEFAKIVAKLRDPNGGCPWDLEQTHQSLKQYVIEEAYEVVDAIDQGPNKLSEELGDLLLQIMIHSQVGCDEGTFTLADVIKSVSDKMVTRHPHVFGEVKVKNSSEVLENWEKIKQKGLKDSKGVLEGVPRSMPSLQRAQRLGEKAARIGFDWADADGVVRKIREELDEFVTALESHNGSVREDAAVKEELGDLLFSIAQWARKSGLNSEEILSQANDKFTARFGEMEALTTKPLDQLSLEELEILWDKAKDATNGK